MSEKSKRTRRLAAAGAALVEWLDDNDVILPDEITAMVRVPAAYLRNLRKNVPTPPSAQNSGELGDAQ
jgi:hypothetical protein